jgi:hypothetical protein
MHGSLERAANVVAPLQHRETTKAAKKSELKKNPGK